MPGMFSEALSEIRIDKGFDAKSCGFTVVGNVLTRDNDTVKVMERLLSFSERV
ncbi:hypothetical protein H8S22_15035 [Anaerostipes sp. NSJ-7]|uniref:Uncharacterized protein n=2 Tax=Anaerostipes TaxID=207244 RepID=A0ABV4DLD6_9FIRM|nr:MULTISPECIES: hypothetical protein [Anaerostipes]MBC5678839.1 hypothetical protein [Anaerostipes hominis (ex Liu et al. 2021)]